MELLIKIPKEFEQHFRADGFEDSLHRLSADAHLLAGLYEQETALMLSEALKNAILVPPHGDLIDRDAAAEKIWGDMRFPSNLANAQFFVNELREMPTIIPAEEEET